MMIQANELRIGNYLDIDGSPAPIQAGWFALIASHSEHLLPSHEPISLTPEILEKCRFVKRELWNEGDWYLHERFRIGLIQKGEIFHCQILNNEGIDTPITSLHQLQNLYWCLTGEELSVQL